ncbi:hypothetical protein Hanom_Chr14g01299081 [Helianthus anomalus]
MVHKVGFEKWVFARGGCLIFESGPFFETIFAFVFFDSVSFCVCIK